MEPQTVSDWAKIRCEPEISISNSTFLLDWMAGAEASRFVGSHTRPFGGSGADNPSAEIEWAALSIVPSHS